MTSISKSVKKALKRLGFNSMEEFQVFVSDPRNPLTREILEYIGYTKVEIDDFLKEQDKGKNGNGK